MAPPYSSLDGAGNNPGYPTWGSARQPLEFVSMGQGYGDHVSTAAGASRPSPRVISNVLFTSQFKWNTAQDVNSWFPFYGQWLAHDMVLQAGPGPEFPIKVPRCDIAFDVNCTDTQWIPFQRHLGSITSKGYLQGNNDATSWLDLSTVYSNDPGRLAALRSLSGGLLKTSVGPNGHLLPYNTAGFANAGGASRTDLFMAGDPRCNINLYLLSLHVLFHLEHNRKAAALSLRHPDWTDEMLFQEARKYTIGLHQKITFSEYLPKLLGKDLPQYIGYDPIVTPAVDVAFISAAFRYGHSGTDDLVYRFEESRTPFAEGHLSVGDTIFNPDEVRRNGLDMILRGMVMQPEADAGARMVPGIRTHPILYDMAAVDIQRGRDRGVPDYNTARVAMGFPRVTSFSQMTNNTAIRAALNLLYNNMSDIDLYVGGLVEAHATGAVIGPLFASIISAQFTRSRNADPFYYLRPGVFSGDELDEIRARSLSGMILDHTNVKWMPVDVFSLDSTMKMRKGYSGAVSSPGTLSASISPLHGYIMSWSIDTIAQVWTVSITSQKGGWVGVGFGSRMAGSDVIVAYIEGGRLIAVDSIVLGEYATTPSSDVNNGHTNDIIDGSVTGSITNGVLTVSFSRKLSTGDPSDHIITPDMTPMIFAHGSTWIPAQHGLFGRAVASVNLYTAVTVYDMVDIHHLDPVVAMSFQTIAIAMAIIQAVILMAVYMARGSRAVFFTGPSLIIASLLGYIMFSLQLYMSASYQTKLSCTISALGLSSVAFNIVYSINTGMLYRFYKIFTDHSHVVTITNKRILQVTLGLALMDMAFGSIWIIGSPIVMQPETPNTCPTSLLGVIIGTIRIIASLTIGGEGVWAFWQLQNMEGHTFDLFRNETKMCGRTAVVSLGFFSVMTVINLITADSVFQKTALLINCCTMLFFSCVLFGITLISKLSFNRATVHRRTRGIFVHAGSVVPSLSMRPVSKQGTADGTGREQSPLRTLDLASLQEALQASNDESEKMVLEFKSMDNMMLKVSKKFNVLMEQRLNLMSEIEYRKQTGYGHAQEPQDTHG